MSSATDSDGRTPVGSVGCEARAPGSARTHGGAEVDEDRAPGPLACEEEDRILEERQMHIDTCIDVCSRHLCRYMPIAMCTDMCIDVCRHV